MLIVRPVLSTDLDDLLDLANTAGVGLTTLPKSKEALASRIENSLKAFSSKPDLKKNAYYLLVLEDSDTGKVVGTSAIAVGVGLNKPFYTYRLLHVTQESTEIEKRVDTTLLQVSNDFIGATEICTLYLAPDYRKGRAGRLLAKARYLLMAAHRDHFSDRVISEIRGWVDDDGHSPFWEAIGRKFFDMSFEEADLINGQGNNQFIMDLMPHYPMYTCLLPECASSVIGKPHASALPAVKMLEDEGFRFADAVDIFDGGPAFEVHKEAIWTLRKATKCKLGGVIDGDTTSEEKMVANASLSNFRVVLGDVVETAGGHWLSSDIASALKVKSGGVIVFSSLIKTDEE